MRRYWRSEFGHHPANPVALVAPACVRSSRRSKRAPGYPALPRYLAEPAAAQAHLPRGTPANPALTVVRERLTEAAARWEGL